jgi:hypothetical protein
MARNEHDAHSMLAGTYSDKPLDVDTAALEALQAEREAAERVMRARMVRRFAFE